MTKSKTITQTRKSSQSNISKVTSSPSTELPKTISVKKKPIQFAYFEDDVNKYNRHEKKINAITKLQEFFKDKEFKIISTSHCYKGDVNKPIMSIVVAYE